MLQLQALKGVRGIKKNKTNQANTQTTAGAQQVDAHTLEPPEEFQEAQSEITKTKLQSVWWRLYFPDPGHLFVLLNNTTHSH